MHEIGSDILSKMEESDDEWITSNQLGYSGPVVRQHVHILRKKGHPIVSSNNGYKVAENAAEIADTIERISGHAIHMVHTVNNLQKILTQYDSCGHEMPDIDQ